MSKDPAFLFYSSDFLNGVADLTMEERGQYITLLCLQHQKGELSEKTIRLCVGNVSVDVLNKFQQNENGNFVNIRLAEEIEKRKIFTESRRNNGLKGGRPKKNEKPSGLPLGYPKENLMEDENENENENENVIKNKKGVNFENLKIDSTNLDEEKNKKVPQKKETIEERKLNFAKTLEPFQNDYPRQMLLNFYEYWTEPNKSNTKFKQEMQSTWDLKRRLKTWASNDKLFNKTQKSNGNGQQPKLFGRQTIDTIVANASGWENL